LTRKAPRKRDPEAEVEARLRALWADYRSVFSREDFTEFIRTAPLIDDPDDVALVEHFKTLPDASRAGITARITTELRVEQSPTVVRP
jgi:hypothetical protein